MSLISKFFKDKKSQRITKQEKTRFFLLFCFMMDESGSHPRGPKSYGSHGSGSTTLISKLTSRKAGELVVVDLLVLLVLSDEGGRLPLLPLDLHVHQLPLQLIVRINERI